ncbi:hypothetical protein BKA67DRAFT_637675 [Truncatella angustata]|uniref:Uncharacterized protein n=1 Tax=Truncatella angustata TaxID=152316 RepID=A0A9P8UGR9_9PEZI|nr:uncharacterized protein BKA67DRAFT_637675 [Truncatella angustata]KAH6651896.1 hypothetical protein BKA67DRAFT_637675 [Truncatella angustata]
MAHAAHHLHKRFEPKPDVQALTGDAKREVDFEPHPERSLDISAGQRQIMQKIINLYSGSASEEDMQVYDKDAIHDDPFSYCDTRLKIAGKLRSLKTEVVKDTPSEIIMEQRHEYTLKLLGTPKAVVSLISLGLDNQGNVRYHKDMWNERNYNHEGLGEFF